MEMADEAMQRFVAEDVDRVSVVLAPRGLHVDRAGAAGHARAGDARADQILAEALLAHGGWIVGKHPSDRALDDAGLWDVVIGADTCAAADESHGH